MSDVTITRPAPVRQTTAASPPDGWARYGWARYARATIGATRIVIAFLFACHGAATLFGILGKTAAPIGAWPGWWAGAIQFVGGGLILLGLFTRPAAILCSGSMAYAYFTVHQASGALPMQNAGELSAMYAWIFLLIAIIGPGAFALDTALRRNRVTPDVA